MAHHQEPAQIDYFFFSNIYPLPHTTYCTPLLIISLQNYCVDYFNSQCDTFPQQFYLSVHSNQIKLDNLLHLMISSDTLMCCGFFVGKHGFKAYRLKTTSPDNIKASYRERRREEVVVKNLCTLYYLYNNQNPQFQRCPFNVLTECNYHHFCQFISMTCFCMQLHVFFLIALFR